MIERVGSTGMAAHVVGDAGEDERGVAAAPPGSGLDLLRAIASYGDTTPLTSARLAALTGRDRGLVSRAVDDLVELGLVTRREDRHLSLTWSFYATAAQLVDRRLVDRGQPLLDLLASRCNESAYLVRRQGTRSLTVAEAMPVVSVRGVSWLGRSHPVARGDAGPALLMDLSRSELRTLLGSGPLPPTTGANAPRTIDELEVEIALTVERGACVLDEQVEAGVASVGAAVRDFRQRIAGAMVIVGPAPRIRGRVEELVDAVRSTADELSSLLGYVSPRGHRGDRPRRGGG